MKFHENLDGAISIDDPESWQEATEEESWTGNTGEIHDPLGRSGCSRIRPCISAECDDCDSEDIMTVMYE